MVTRTLCIEFNTTSYLRIYDDMIIMSWKSSTYPQKSHSQLGKQRNENLADRSQSEQK